MCMQKKPHILVDVDDVLFDCNGYALRLCSQRTGKKYNIENITGWGLLGIPEDERLELFKDPEFFKKQRAYPGAKEFLKKLQKKAEVELATSVPPEFMSIRGQRIYEELGFSLDRVIMAPRKASLRADMMLDDGFHNLSSAGVKHPVLFRRPWNHGMSGMCAVNTYDQFLALVDTVFYTRTSFDPEKAKVICLLGPSGCGKNKIAKQLEGKVAGSGKGYIHLPTLRKAPGEEVSGSHFEETFYCGRYYASDIEPVNDVLRSDNHAVMVMDVTGCMAMRAAFPDRCVIAYVQADKRDCVRNTVEKWEQGTISKEEMLDRICAVEVETKNKDLADIEISIKDISLLIDLAG